MHGTKPKQNRKFWADKITRNRERDALVNRGLRKAGWRVLRIWEHELTKKNERRLVARLRRWLGERWKRDSETMRRGDLEKEGRAERVVPGGLMGRSLVAPV